MGDNVGKYSERHVKIRTVSAGAKTIGSSSSKYLEIDSGVNGAEIQSILAFIESWSITTPDVTVELHVPATDNVLSPAERYKRDEFVWSYGPVKCYGLISGIISFPYNMFLKFGIGVGNLVITDVIIVYRSSEDVTAEWEA